MTSHYTIKHITATTKQFVSTIVITSHYTLIMQTKLTYADLYS